MPTHGQSDKIGIEGRPWSEANGFLIAPRLLMTSWGILSLSKRRNVTIRSCVQEGKGSVIGRWSLYCTFQAEDTK